LEGLIVLKEKSGLAHLDIKPENIIIKDDYSLGIIDFGLSRSVGRPTSEPCGTKSY
jgi:serine/threonine protein kinase